MDGIDIDIQCLLTLVIQELQPALNVNVSSEKLLLNRYFPFETSDPPLL